MKKTLYILIACATMMCVTTSCENFLDITPEGQVERDDLLTTDDGIEDAMYGVYAQLRNSSLYGQELSFSALEIMAQELSCYGNDAITALGEYDYTYSDVEGTFENVWELMYNNISNVNSVLACDLVKDATEYPYTIYRGEALGLRAFMHFDLMRIYCEQITQNESASGIPYATQFSLVTPEFETLQMNYEHVIADLLEAERLLANEDQYKDERLFMEDRQIHFNLYAVQATLARVYLTKGDKEKAYEYAKKVIDNSGRTLTDKVNLNGDLAGVLSRNETIFGVYYAQFYSLVYPKLYKMQSFYTLDVRKDTEAFYNEDMGDGKDFRYDAYFEDKDNGGTPKKLLSKLLDRYELQGIISSRPADFILGINMIRLPEMHYICAEALLDKDPEKARSHFDKVISSRGLTPLAERTSENDDNKLSLDRINNDRRKEFIGEGQTFFNMKRLNLAIGAYDEVRVFQPSKQIYVVPIPDVEYENRN